MWARLWRGRGRGRGSTSGRRSPCHLIHLVTFPSSSATDFLYGEPGFYSDTQHFGCDGRPDGDGSEIWLEILSWIRSNLTSNLLTGKAVSLVEAFGSRLSARLLSKEHQTCISTATDFGKFTLRQISILFLWSSSFAIFSRKWHWSQCRYIYNLLDFNDRDSFYAAEKPDLVSPSETSWDLWSSTLVDLIITSRFARQVKSMKWKIKFCGFFF